MYFDKDRLIRELINNTNSTVESVTLENFEDMSEDELRSLILIGSGRIRHAYRPESLYYQYVSRRGRTVTDPLDPSYELTQEDLEKVFNEMRKKYEGFEPQIFTQTTIIQNNTSKLIEDDNTLRYEDGRPHNLLSQRNTYLDNLERDFNNMINNVKQKRPQEYDKGKGPGGFPMRNRGGSGNYGMPAREPKFEEHLIWLYDPDRRYKSDNTLAYDYNLFPKNKYLFCPGNSKPGQIQSQKMPEWMTTDPSRRDKVTFMDELQGSPTQDNNPILSIEYPTKMFQEVIEYEEPPKKENRKLWLIIAFILFVFLLKKKRY
jgi:hypothetical protein